jgi:peptidoglycan/LPS O-acetylase OafA/YrhL
MFVVFALFELFVLFRAPPLAVPALFIAVILASGLLGVLLARVYSEPINRTLRTCWGHGPSKLGSLIERALTPTIANSDQQFSQPSTQGKQCNKMDSGFVS